MSKLLCVHVYGKVKCLFCYSLLIEAGYLLGPEAHQLALGAPHYCSWSTAITGSYYAWGLRIRPFHSLPLWVKDFIHWSPAPNPHSLFSTYFSWTSLVPCFREYRTIWRFLEAPAGYNHYKRLLSAWDLELGSGFYPKNCFLECALSPSCCNNSGKHLLCAGITLRTIPCLCLVFIHSQLWYKVLIWGYSSLLELLPSMCETWNNVPSTGKKIRLYIWIGNLA